MYATRFAESVKRIINILFANKDVKKNFYVDINVKIIVMINKLLALNAHKNV
jgi:hypothetical protein